MFSQTRAAGGFPGIDNMAAKSEVRFGELAIGQMVAYPNQGVCLVVEIEKKTIGSSTISFYALRVLRDNSTIFVPTANAESVGIRPVINPDQYALLLEYLEADFDDVTNDWKVRSRTFGEKLQSGDVFAAADVLKMLTFLSHEKKLSLREQNYLDKARFLIISEITNGGFAAEEWIEVRLEKMIERACRRHRRRQPFVSPRLGH